MAPLLPGYTATVPAQGGAVARTPDSSARWDQQKSSVVKAVVSMVVVTLLGSFWFPFSPWEEVAARRSLLEPNCARLEDEAKHFLHFSRKPSSAFVLHWIATASPKLFSLVSNCKIVVFCGALGLGPSSLRSCCHFPYYFASSGLLKSNQPL